MNNFKKDLARVKVIEKPPEQRLFKGNFNTRNFDCTSCMTDYNHCRSIGSAGYNSSYYCT